MSQEFVTVEEFEKFKKSMESQMKKSMKETKEKKEKVPRPLSKYQLFMQEQLPKYKAEHPDVDHKKAFAEVGKLWKSSQESKEVKEDTAE